jgi:GTP-binding protein
LHASKIQTAAFLLSVGDLSQLPPDSGVEVAVAGRSNAGKSSAINAICGQRKLAFVSRTPGRTQAMNFFDLGGRRYLVDLPGYGYAKVPSAVRSHWEALLGVYLRTRRSLHGLILVTDARHPLTVLDRRMLGWFAVTGRPVHVLMSKSDKLSRQAAQRQRIETEAALAQLYPVSSLQLFSSVTSAGVEQARQALSRLLGASDEPSGPATGRPRPKVESRRRVGAANRQKKTPG